MSQTEGAELMVRHLGVSQADALKNCGEEYGDYISYKMLREYYLTYLDTATRLADPEDPGDLEELERIMTTCVKCYLLYFVGCLLFGDKRNKHI